MPLFEIITQETILRTVRRTYEAESKAEALRFNLLRARPVSEDISEERRSFEDVDSGRPQESLGLEDS